MFRAVVLRPFRGWLAGIVWTAFAAVAAAVVVFVFAGDGAAGPAAPSEAAKMPDRPDDLSRRLESPERRALRNR